MRINEYNLKTDITSADKLLGSSTSGTHNYNVSDLSKYASSQTSVSAIPSANNGYQSLNVNGAGFVWSSSNSRYVPQRTSLPSGIKRVITFGDSITAEANSGGWPSYFSVLSNGEYIVTYNDGVAGTTLAQMDARFESIPSWVKADIIMIQGGTNSPGVTEANKNALISLINKTIARGAIPQVHSCPPLLNMTPIADWNFWMANYCANRGIEFIDKWSTLADPATGGLLSAYSRDTTHPNPAGQMIAAQKLLDIMRAKSGTPNDWTFPLMFSNTTGTSGLLSNPLNLLDSNADGNGDGWNAPNFQGSQTPIPCSAVSSRTSATWPAIGRPQRYQDTFLYTSQGSYVRHSKDIYGVSTRANHRIQIVQHFKLNAITEAVNNTVVVEFLFGSNGSTNYTPFNKKFNAVGLSGILVTEFVLPPSLTEMYVTWRAWNGNGTADFEVCNLEIYDLTELGLA